jgi:hypothetical protein
MKVVKIAAVLIVPAIMAGTIAAALYSITGQFEGLFSHDVCEAHTHAALIPFITVIAIAAGFLPGVFYMANVLFPVNRAEAEAVTEAAAAILTAQPEGLHIGQIFTSPGANCQFRVKTIKAQAI